ncbi:MAG: hypothetical protein KDE32_09690 [Novosphingobium sp.]|nr:hypothetical protein [Novosphingobium sp.]
MNLFMSWPPCVGVAPPTTRIGTFAPAIQVTNGSCGMLSRFGSKPDQKEAALQAKSRLSFGPAVALASVIVPAVVPAVVLVAGVAFLPAFAHAQETARQAPNAEAEQNTGPEGKPGARYSMAPMNGGMVRLDQETGTMDFCTTKSGQLVCRLANEEREGYENEIERLQSRVRELEAERPGEPETSLDEDRRLNEAMRHAGKALRRFFDAVKDLRADMEKEEGSR